MYELLVEGHDDFLGIMAYSVYKRQKHEVIASLTSAEGKPPTNAELLPFHNMARSETQLSHFHNEALRLTEAFCAQVLEERSAELKSEYEQKFQAKCCELKPSFWFGVWQSVVGSVVFLLVMAVLVILLWTSKEGGPRAVLESVFDVKIIDQSSHPTSPK